VGKVIAQLFQILDCRLGLVVRGKNGFFPSCAGSPRAKDMIVCLDADCTGSFVEQNAVWGPKITARLAALRAAGDEIAVSDLARTECLAKPLATGDAAVVADYQAFFTDPDIRVLPLTAAVCERTAKIRAASSFKLKVPDCLHLAAAIEYGCGLVLTHDARLRQCKDIAVEILTGWKPRYPRSRRGSALLAAAAVRQGRLSTPFKPLPQSVSCGRVSRAVRCHSASVRQARGGRTDTLSAALCQLTSKVPQLVKFQFFMKTRRYEVSAIIMRKVTLHVCSLAK
jgi:predicted nucleic acid-binding protein